jgi:hypothetical protein
MKPSFFKVLHNNTIKNNILKKAISKNVFIIRYLEKKELDKIS